MINQLKETFEKWSPAIFIGYNSLSFDEEFLRKTFKIINRCLSN